MRNSKEVFVGNIKIGGNSQISVQSMTNVDTHDYDKVKAQILSLQKAGCDIVRFTVPDVEAVKTIYRLKSDGISIPLVADIHFDYKIAIESANAGIDKNLSSRVSNISVSFASLLPLTDFIASFSIAEQKGIRMTVERILNRVCITAI